MVINTIRVYKLAKGNLEYIYKYKVLKCTNIYKYSWGAKQMIASHMSYYWYNARVNRKSMYFYN